MKLPESPQFTQERFLQTLYDLVPQICKTVNKIDTASPAAVVLRADVVNNNGVANTIADVTGLTFLATSGEVYWFEATIPYTAAAATTGSRWSVNGPAASLLNYTSTYTLDAVTSTTNYATAYDIPAASNASSLTAGNVAKITGFVKPSSTGMVAVSFASEVAGSAITAKVGAILRWQRVF
jgi:hypothetical protein